MVKKTKQNQTKQKTKNKNKRQNKNKNKITTTNKQTKQNKKQNKTKQKAKQNKKQKPLISLTFDQTNGLCVFKVANCSKFYLCVLSFAILCDVYQTIMIFPANLRFKCHSKSNTLTE